MLDNYIVREEGEDKSNWENGFPQKPMNIFLYPFSDNAKEGISDAAYALKDACEDLLGPAIDYYKIRSWDTDKKKPDFPSNRIGLDGEWIGDRFIDFLEGNNGTGDNVKNLTGAHLLIHDRGGENQWGGCEHQENEYHGGGAGAEATSMTGFNEGLAAWAPYCPYNKSLGKAAAIQETLHQFIDHDHAKTQECSGYIRDHSAGTLNCRATYYDYVCYCTPMLAYHWDDEDSHSEDPDCVCPRDVEKEPDGYTTDLTSCTIESVEETAENKA